MLYEVGRDTQSALHHDEFERRNEDLSVSRRTTDVERSDSFKLGIHELKIRSLIFFGSEI